MMVSISVMVDGKVVGSADSTCDYNVPDMVSAVTRFEDQVKGSSDSVRASLWAIHNAEAVDETGV